MSAKGGANEVLDWKEAVRQTCLRRNRIMCSAADVMDDHKRVKRPDVFEHWPVERIAEHLREVQQAQLLSHRTHTATTSSASYVIQSVASTLRLARDTSFFLLESTGVIQPTDYSATATSRSSSQQQQHVETKGAESMQVAGDLCIEAIERIREATMLETPTVVPVPKFRAWILARLDPTAAPLVPWLQALPVVHFDLLLQVIAFPSYTADPEGEAFHCFGVVAADNNCTSSIVDTHITIYKLDRAVEKQQQLLHDYQQKAATSLSQARQTKRKNVMAYKRYKLYTQQIDTAEAALLNLATVRERVVEQVGQRTVVAALEEAVSTMARLRLDTAPVDDLMDGLAEEMEASQQVQDTLGGSHQQQADYDEQELLAELEALQLEDDDTGSHVGGLGSTGLPPPVPRQDDFAQSEKQGESNTAKVPVVLSTTPS